MAVKTLSFKILVLISGLLFASTLAILVAVWLAIHTHAQDQINERLNVGVNVFEQVLASRDDVLINTANVLTSDFGFKQAVATRDSATIESALLNQSERINADLMAIVSLEGEVVASTSAEITTSGRLTSQQLIRNVLERGHVSSMFQAGDDIYQTFLLSVDAPIPIAITIVGFKLDKKLAADLKKITGLDISFVSRQAEGIESIASTLPESDYAAMLASDDADDSGMRLPFTSRQILKSRVYELFAASDISIQAYLTDDLNKIFSKFELLQIEIGLIAALAISLALATGLIFSRSLTRPLFRLAAVSRDIARGDYTRSMEVESTTQEIGDLVTAFDSMQSDIRQREERIGYQATHDLLTGLVNRAEMTRRIDHAVSDQQAFHLVGINIVNFRSVNDMFGHPVGDKCLQELAARLKLTNSIAARLSGADFIIMVKGNMRKSQINALRNSLERGYGIDALNIKLRVKFGVVSYPEHAETSQELIRRMEIAVDYANQTNNDTQYYQPGQEEDYVERLQLVDDLRQALSEQSGGLQMYYQPKLNIAAGRVTRLEALIRWIHPERGFISPELFVPLAEQAGLINLLTVWVVTQVSKQNAQWRAQGVNLQVAINLSAHDLASSEILDFIIFQQKQYRLPSNSLAFEITESELMSQPDVAMALLKRFRDAGFDLAIDDFGTGYSSLSQLKSMPVSELKIDRCFVMNLANNRDDQVIVKSTIELAHSFDMAVIAEGVEDEAVLKLLAGWGCEWAQGYYLSKPMPAAEVAPWIANYNSKPSNVINLSNS